MSVHVCTQVTGKLNKWLHSADGSLAFCRGVCKKCACLSVCKAMVIQVTHNAALCISLPTGFSPTHTSLTTQLVLGGGGGEILP